MLVGIGCLEFLGSSYLLLDKDMDVTELGSLVIIRGGGKVKGGGSGRLITIIGKEWGDGGGGVDGGVVGKLSYR